MELRDRSGRKISYLRLSVTDRCNQRCIYCMPGKGIEFASRENILRLEELAGLALRFVTLFAIDKIRVTGGEPLVRKNIEVLVEILSGVPSLQDIALTTNGSLLGSMAERLREAGLRRINVSLDSLDPSRYAYITGGGRLEDTLGGLKAARAAGFDPIKINTVLVPDFREEVELVEWANREGFILRFIELMPQARGVEAPIKLEGPKEDEILSRLEKRFGRVRVVSSSGDGQGKTSRRYEIDGGNMIFEMIPGVTVPFCGDCNRIRLDCQGALRACLYSREKLDLKPFLNARDEDFVKVLTEFIETKTGRVLEHIGSDMSSIGG